MLVLAGDDHGCQSSTLPHQSEQVFEAAMIPVLNPASVQEYLDLGMLGFAMSRYSGTWTAFKAISETVESSASVHVDPNRLEIHMPTDFEMPAGGLNIRLGDAPMVQEARLMGPKMEAVAAFARANGFDRIVHEPTRPARIGIMATGKGYLDLRQALSDLGLPEDRLNEMGVRIYKVALTWPLEREGALKFAEGLEEVIVVEEKRGLIEDQLMKLLYHVPADRRPSVVGKTDERGKPLMPSTGELSPTMVARAIAERSAAARSDRSGDGTAPGPDRGQGSCIVGPAAEDHAHAVLLFRLSAQQLHQGAGRQRAGAGIGCHGMAIWMPERRTQTMTHMGAEGVTWVGQSPFTEEEHIFQNLGDGTYYHSGLLAIRAASAAGVNITYKILYNDAVAMTGGQPHDGTLTVWDISAAGLCRRGRSASSS